MYSEPRLNSRLAGSRRGKKRNSSAMRYRAEVECRGWASPCVIILALNFQRYCVTSGASHLHHAPDTENRIGRRNRSKVITSTIYGDG